MNAVIDTEARPMRVAPHPTHKYKLLLRRDQLDSADYLAEVADTFEC